MRKCTQNAVSPFVSRRFCGIPAALVGVWLVSLVFLTGCGLVTQPSRSLPSKGEWLDFQGTWTATGSRNTLRLGGDRSASISIFNGSLVLGGSSPPSVGFRSEAITFGDSVTGMVGRAVWTDEHGDKAYSNLRGEGTTKNNKIIGTFLGGTGRYSRITGQYEFSWRFVLENEDGVVQGQSLGLKGRIRIDSQELAANQSAPRL